MNENTLKRKIYLASTKFEFSALWISISISLTYTFARVYLAQGGWFGSFLIPSIERLSTLGPQSFFPSASATEILGTTPYHPLMAILGSLLFKWDVADLTIIYILGSLSFVIFSFTLLKVFQIFTSESKYIFNAQHLFILFTLIIFFVDRLTLYTFEAKPDLLNSALGLYGFYRIIKNSEEDHWDWHLICTCFLGILCKQQFVGFIFGYLLLFAFSSFNFKKRFASILLGSFSGILVLLLFFPHWYEYAMASMGRHGLGNLNFLWFEAKNAFHKIILTIILLGFVLWELKFCFQSLKRSMAPSLYTLFIFPSIILCPMAFFKAGGDIANIELIILLLSPLIIFQWGKLPFKSRSAATPSLALILLALVLIIKGPQISQLYNDIEKFKILNQITISYLKKKFPNKKVAYLCPFYPLLKNANLQPTSDLATYWQLRFGNDEESFIDFKKQFLELRPDLIIGLVLAENPYLEIFNQTRGLYRPYYDKDLPLGLYGKIYVRDKPYRLKPQHDEWKNNPILLTYGRY